MAKIEPLDAESAFSSSGSVSVLDADAAFPTAAPAVGEEKKEPFIQSVAETFYAGMVSEGSKPGVAKRAYAGAERVAIDVDKMLGLGSFKFVKSAEAQAMELEKGNPGFAGDIAETLGNLGVQLPLQTMLGAATKAALVGKVIPEVAPYIAEIPHFAVGMGEEAGVKAAEAGKEPVVPALEAGAKGILYASVGEGLTAIPALTALGAADAGYEALKTGRYPTKEELTHGGMTGAAYGVLFSVFPILAHSSEEKEFLLKQHEAMKEAVKAGDYDELQTILGNTKAGVESMPVGRFHGTSKKIENLSDLTYSSLNYYGQGFYTTDDFKIAEGYTKKGKGGEPTLYEVVEKKSVSLYNAEQIISDALKNKLKASFGDYDYILFGDSDNSPVKNLREAFDRLREDMTSNLESSDTIQEYFDGIRSVLEKEGYRGISHIGGLKTGRSAHKVNIYWFPESDLAIKEATLKTVNISEDTRNKIEVLLDTTSHREHFVDDDLIPFFEKVKDAGKALRGSLEGIKGAVENLLYPAFKFERKGESAKALSAKTIRQVKNFSFAELLGFPNLRSKIFDNSYGEIERFFDSMPDKDLRLFNLTRGEAQSPEGKVIQAEARKELGKRYKDSRLMEAIKDISDWAFELADKNGIDINYRKDYFFGQFKPVSEMQKDSFWDYWTSSDRFTKEKKLPTIADAEAFGYELREANPVRNIKNEARQILYQVGLNDLKNHILENAPEFGVLRDKGETGTEAGATDYQKRNWQMIHDPVFQDMLFEPEYARLVNGLISKNKVMENPFLKGLSNWAFAHRVVKFAFSDYHLKNIMMAQISDQPMGVFSGEGYKGIGKSIKSAPFKDIQTQYPEQYKEWVLTVGEPKSSIEIQVSDDLKKAVEKFGNGNWLGGILRLPKAILGKTKWIPMSPAQIDWMFEEFIPALKFRKWMQDVSDSEKNQGRPVTEFEKLQIGRRIQTYFGEMNEQLFGRSGTVTSGMRILFNAPGYGEGNFMAIYAAGKEIAEAGKTRKITAEGSRNARFVASSLFTSLVMASIWNLLNGHLKFPKSANEVRDLFKTNTGLRDGNGDEVFLDTMGYTSDFWSVYGNLMTGQVGKIPQQLTKRISGMVSPEWKTLTELSLIFSGGSVHDYIGNPVYFKSDDLGTKVGKFIQYKLKEALPIAFDTFMSMDKKGINPAEAIVMAGLGLRPTPSEDVKEIRAARSDMFDMLKEKSVEQSAVNKLANEDEEKAQKRAESFNRSQLKKLKQVMEKFNVEPPSRQVLNRYLIESVRGKSVVSGSEVSSMFRKQRRSSQKRIFTPEQRDEQEKILQEHFVK